MSGKADFVEGHHGPAIIEGPATALSWLTILPVFGTATAFDRTTGTRAMNSLPIVGIALGTCTFAIIYPLIFLGIPELLIATLCIAGWQLGTRMLHLDGLADVGDALGAHTTPERAQQILADQTTGALGMGSVVLVLLTQLTAISALITQLPTATAAFLIAIIPLITRTAALLPCHRTFKPMSEHGFGAMVIGTVRASTIVLWTLIIAATTIIGGRFSLNFSQYDGAILATDLTTITIASLLITLVAALLLSLHYAKRFHGLNGDCIGAIIEITTALTAIAMVVAFNLLNYFTTPGI
ncbi:adenosylcobinamide-GDP ribazoletransferase [Corynebacterium freiburgense]|uniref:adenosylcobinamide-GDP ribazoletransferase n=1 Tax=Corynebacterium freiburgense TaxID=556548 RepID=UPI0003FBEA0B|nr:adenosylcobinamide-GDP ribazoletransferase [Corynebacterium freiburgense]WJZ03198.1 Cobalamin synthase [Corynebacterium freiburgense]